MLLHIEWSHTLEICTRIFKNVFYYNLQNIISFSLQLSRQISIFFEKEKMLINDILFKFNDFTLSVFQSCRYYKENLENGYLEVGLFRNN